MNYTLAPRSIGVHGVSWVFRLDSGGVSRDLLCGGYCGEMMMMIHESVSGDERNDRESDCSDHDDEKNDHENERSVQDGDVTTAL